jgi:hypothetical protein
MNRVLTIVFVLLAIPVMAQDELGISPKTDKMLPDVLGVCGPIHQAIFELGPKKYNPKLDTEYIWVQEIGANMNIVIFPAPEITNSVLPDHPPMALQLHEFKGKVQAAAGIWHASVEEYSEIWHDLLDQLTESNGQPTKKEEGFVKWQGDLVNTEISWPGNEEDLYISWSCQQTLGEYVSARDAAENNDERSVTEAGGSNDGLDNDPWKRESVASIIKGYGQPSDLPIETGEDVVGLHYGDLDMSGFLYEEWFWFFEGKAIYSASEFLPVGGASIAPAAFRAMREMAFNTFGEPDENTLGDDGNLQRIIWRNGSQAVELTFVEGDGDPRFLVERYDTKHLDKIDTELRPVRTLPNRYEPPPPDSGTDREDFAPEVAEG